MDEMVGAVGDDIAVDKLVPGRSGVRLLWDHLVGRTAAIGPMSTASTVPASSIPIMYMPSACVPTRMSDPNPTLGFGGINRVCNYVVFLEASSLQYNYIEQRPTRIIKTRYR